jgi:RNA polymerase sigma-70 factor (ECF subfamily)
VSTLRLDAGWWSDLLRKVTRRTHNGQDAEDLLHSAFLRLEQWRQSGTVHNPAGFMMRTAYNLNIDLHRRSQLISEHDWETACAELADSAPLQDELVLNQARLRRVKDGLDRLSPRTREVYLMHRIEELKYREIAARLGISQSAVEKHIAKAALFLAEWTRGW